MAILKSIMLGIFMLLSSLWLLLLLWVHQPLSSVLSYLFMLLWFLLAVGTFYSYQKKSKYYHRAVAIYLSIFFLALLIFFNMTAKNNRDWRAENQNLMSFRFVDGQVEIENVRNFIWTDQQKYDVQWETRRYRLEDIRHVDLIVSHFMSGPIAHVFVSFKFADGEYLSFSLEVREEKGEGFSSIGGFFRQYELALVVGDENDLIFSRTNIRKEDVYIYPLNMQQTEMQMMFVEYLNKANRLKHQPRWYNTLMSNCTTILFDLAEHATGSIPRDYRVLLPGLLPSYLYDYGQLSDQISLAQWRKIAYVNPKTQHLTQGSETENTAFSALIREDLLDLEQSILSNHTNDSDQQTLHTR